MSGGFPIACFSCGKVISHLYEKYLYLTVGVGKHGQDALDDLRVRKECCRGIFLAHVDKQDVFLMYPDTITMNSENLGWKKRVDTPQEFTARFIVNPFTKDT